MFIRDNTVLELNIEDNFIFSADEDMEDEEEEEEEEEEGEEADNAAKKIANKKALSDMDVSTKGGVKIHSYYVSIAFYCTEIVMLLHCCVT